jgi:hypothetical protein
MEVNPSATVLTPRVRSRLATLLFLIAWILGAFALTAGFESGSDLPAACTFAIACGIWWISYRVCQKEDGRGLTLGLVALEMWILNLTGALLLDFRHYVADLLFWAATAIVLFLITAVALSKPLSESSSLSPSSS